MSKIVKLSVVIEKVAQDLKYDAQLIEKLAMHQFEFVKKFQQDPTSARLHLFKFGMFDIPRWKFYDVIINKIIPAVRAEPTPQMYDVLRRFLKLRHTLAKYYTYQEYKIKKQNGLYKKVTTKIGDADNDRDILGEGSTI